MKIKTDKNKNITIISDVKEFDLIKTLKSGQTFRYYIIEERDAKTTFNKLNVSNVSVVVINNNIATLLEPIESGLIVHSVEKNVVDEWINFFNLRTDYAKIKDDIIKIEKKMKKYITSSSGVRIIKQDEWETIITFIISANNNMARIKKIINDIANEYGKFICEVEGIKCYCLPKPKELAKLKEEQLRKVGVGFRDKYLIDAAKKISTNEIDLGKINELSSIELKNELMKINGVGNKVADCIRLIGFNRMESFPVDVWIERFMLEIFLNDGKKYTREEIEMYGSNKFKDLAGYTQQYIFYYCTTYMKQTISKKIKKKIKQNKKMKLN